MSISSLKNSVHKRVELQKYKRDFSDIGSFIKKKRKELNITQDVVSNGICSISYLSKIENNQIVPSEFYVKEIMDKLDIDQAVYEKSLRDKEYVKEIINDFFYMNDEGVEKIFDEIKGVEHNLIINLVKLGYVVYFNLDDQNQYVMMLEHLVNNMTDVEMELYLYFSSVYFVEHEKYKTALELLLLQEKLPQQNEYLTAMCHELAYIVKQRLHITNCANDDYTYAMGIYTKFHNVHRIVRLAMQKIKSIAKEHPKQALRMIKTIKVDLLDQDEQANYHYLHATILFSLQRYNEATLQLKFITETSQFYLRKMTLLLRICHIEHDFEMIASIKEVLQHFTPHKTEMRSKIYYHYLLQESDEDQKEFLRDIAIPFSIKVEDYERLHEYTHHIMDICINHSRYKEAVQFYNKYQKEITKVQKILY